MAQLETCGFCRGSGRVPGRKHDAYGPRPDYPELVACEYCGGAGQCRDGSRLLPARLAAAPQAYSPETVRAYG